MLSVIIPTCTTEYLVPLLNSLSGDRLVDGKLEAGEGTAHMVIADSGLVDFVQTDWPMINMVKVPQPFVFAKAINLAVQASEPGSDLLILNDDTLMLTPMWRENCKKVLEVMRRQHWGLVSLRIEGGVGNREQAEIAEHSADISILIKQTAKTVCFVAVLIAREVFDVVGPLDERFIGYGYDDDDYCLRVRQAGFKVGITGLVTVKHGVDGFVHSSTFARVNNQQEWERKYALNRKLFVEKWQQGKGMRGTQRQCLNVGCGNNPVISTLEEMWTNLDWKAGENVQVVRDLRRGIPFNDESFDHLLCDNVLEHFTSEDVIFLLNEMDRVLKVGGTLELIVPHAHSQGAIQDPTHKSLFVPRSALYWNQKATPMGGKFVGITANLMPIKIETFGDQETELFIRFLLRKTDG